MGTFIPPAESATSVYSNGIWDVEIAFKGGRIQPFQFELTRNAVMEFLRVNYGLIPEKIYPDYFEMVSYHD